MDTVRRLSYLLMLLGIITVIILSCFQLWSETAVVAYCIFSIAFLLYCISKQLCATNQNKIIYEIMRCSKSVKKMIFKKSKMSKGVEDSAVYMEEGLTKDRDNNSRNRLNQAVTMGKVATASLFFDLSTVDAAVKCCKPFYMKWTNYVKIDRYDGEYENMIVNNDWYKPGPERQSIYINGSIACDFDLYCVNTYYKGLLDSLWYIIGIVILYIVTKSVLFTYSVLKTPVSTYTTEEYVTSVVVDPGTKNKQNNIIKGNNKAVYNSLTKDNVSNIKIVRTNYKYCSFFRSMFIILYLITFSTCMAWVFKLINITPVNALYYDSNSKITIYNETVDYLTFQDFLKTPEDLVSMNETNYEALILKHYNASHNVTNSDTTAEPTDTTDTVTEATSDKSNSRKRRSIYDILRTEIHRNHHYNTNNTVDPLSNLTCTYDAHRYLIKGVLDAECYYNSSNWGVLLYRKPSKYIKIDSRCYEQLNIDQSRLGNPVCYDYCEKKKVKGGRKREECGIRYDPNIVKMTILNERPMDHNQHEMNHIKLLMGEEAKRNDKIIINYTGRLGRSIAVENTVTRYGVGTYIFEEWRTQFSNANGAIFLAEYDSSDTACIGRERNLATYQAVCSHRKRQMISCEPNLWGSYSQDSNTFDCVVPTAAQLALMPNWRKTGINIPYSIPVDSYAGDLPNYREERTVGFRTSATVITPVELTIEQIWGKKYQDNVQQIGGMKYFIYSALFRISQTPQSNQVQPFPQVYSNFIDYFNRWESRVFDNSYHMDRQFPNTGQRLIPDIMMSINYLDTPTENNMRQDRAYVNFIFKSDVYTDNGVLINPLAANWQAGNPCSSGTSTNVCSWLVPLYFAIRIYGPALAEIKFFNRLIDTVAFNNDVCSSVNAVKMNGICYMIDHDTVSTDLIVGGYPWTNWSAMFTSEWTAVPEFPSFYLNHPKTGSGQYMAQVSDAANIGFYSQQGRCSDTYYENGILMCDGNAAVNIRMVEYTTFHRPLLGIPSCRIHVNNTLDCQFTDPTSVYSCDLDPYDTGLDKGCTRNVTSRYLKNIDEASGHSIKTPITSYRVQRGYDTCNTGDCTGTYFLESAYRCTFCVVIICMVAGVGYIALFMHLVLCIVCYINRYTLGRLGRALKLSFLFDWYYTPTCSKCGMYMYNEIEKNKHDNFCIINQCPYCITINPSNEVCMLKFPNKTNFKLHMNIHKTIRRNPYIGYIRARRNKVVSFTIVVLVSLNSINPASAQYFASDSGLRSNKVGSNITVPNENVRCSGQGCRINTNYRATVPLTDGSQIVLNTDVDGNRYSKKITIENPHLETSCDYLYSSSKIIVGNRRLVYVCLGKTTCNYDNQDSMLLNPLAGRTGNQFIPMDPYNPLKSYYCPKAIACQSPIVDFFWLTAGCWTIDDGTAVGFEYYLPDVKDIMAHVFRCTVNSINYKICEGTLCRNIDGDSSDIESGEVHFEHITNNLPVQFTIAATSLQGEDRPNHIYYNVPDNNANTDNGPFAMKMNRISQGETCVQGVQYNGGTCEVNSHGSSPALNCDHHNPNMDDNYLIDNYQSLSDVYHCNFEQAVLTWNTEIVSRSVTIGEVAHEDTQTVSWPSINLNNSNCNFGFIEVDMLSMETVTMEQVKYEGEIKSTKCDGWYNRNNKARITFQLSEHAGIIEIHCPNLFSETCLFDSTKVDFCNVTMMLPNNSTCSYNGKEFDINCDNLRAYVPDPASGDSIGWTGSEDKDTWLSGFKLALSKWWNITLITIGSFLLLIFLVWITISCCRCYKDASAAGYYSRKRDVESSDNNRLLIDNDMYDRLYQSDNKDVRLRYRPQRLVAS